MKLVRRHHFKYVKHLKELLLSTLFLFALVAGHSVGLASISPSKYTVEGHIVDVKARTTYDGQLVIAGGVIQEIKRLPQALPAHAPYLMPGFIDAHVHIESSMVTPAAYAQEVVRHGTIGAICDAHEIANVLGTAGIDYMIESGRKADFHFMFGAPSCVPCTTFEGKREAWRCRPQSVQSAPRRGTAVACRSCRC